MDELRDLIVRMESASVQLHAAMLRFDIAAGDLRLAVNEIRLDQARRQALGESFARLAEIEPDSRHHTLVGIDGGAS